MVRESIGIVNPPWLDSAFQTVQGELSSSELRPSALAHCTALAPFQTHSAQSGLRFCPVSSLPLWFKYTPCSDLRNPALDFPVVLWSCGFPLPSRYFPGSCLPPLLIFPGLVSSSFTAVLTQMCIECFLPLCRGLESQIWVRHCPALEADLRHVLVHNLGLTQEKWKALKSWVYRD